MKKLIAFLVFVFMSSTAVFAQNGGEKAAPPDGLSEIAAYSLFYENYKNEQYESALKYGRWILKEMPESIEGYSKFSLSTQLDRLITVYSQIAQMKSDPSAKEAYADTAEMIFDEAFKRFSEDEIDYHQWYITKGSFYGQNDFIENYEAKQATAYQKAFEMDPERTTKAAEGYFVKAMLQAMVAQDTDEAKQQALAVIEKSESHANEDLKDYFDKTQNKLYDSPEERITFLEEKLQKNPEDQDALRQLRNLYKDQDNLAEVQKLNEKLYELDPSYQNTTALANTAIENANFSAAVKYLNEAKSKTEETEKLKSIYENLANAYLNQGNLRQARSNARQAIDADSEWGRPYILMADIYARAVSNCSEGRDLQRSDRAVYWLVIDYLNRAKRADSSVSNVANNRLQSYREVTPSKEDIFFMDSWKEGQSIRIDGSLASCYSWIGESTTVR